MVQDARNFKFSSDYPMPIVAYQKDVTIVKTSSGDTKTTKIEHGLPFRPLVLGKYSENEDFSTAVEVGNMVAYNNTLCWVFSDDKYIYINLTSNSAVTRYVRLIGMVPPDYNGDTDTISTNTNFLLDTDNNYAGCISGVADTTVDGDNGYYVYHGLGYCPQAKIWEETYDTEYTDGGSTTVYNVLETNPSYIDRLEDGRYRLTSAVTDNYLAIAAYYNPTTGAISPNDVTDHKTYYQIYTEEA